MSSRHLEVPLRVLKGFEGGAVIIGDIDAFMESYEAGDQAAGYEFLLRTVQGCFAKRTDEQVRFLSNNQPPEPLEIETDGSYFLVSGPAAGPEGGTRDEARTESADE